MILTCLLQASEALGRHNAGLLQFARRDYSNAYADFQAVPAAADPAAAAAAANNAAVCCVYLSQVRHQTCQWLKVVVSDV